MTDAALGYLEPINEGTSSMPTQPAPYIPYQSNFKGFITPDMDLGVQPFKAEPLKLDLNDPFGMKR
jgi:hypothetical protein